MIRKLNESESLKEISRMISGDQWSETSGGTCKRNETFGR